MRVAAEGLRNDLLQLKLHLDRVLARGDAGAVHDAKDVRVDRKGLLAERGVEDDVRRLPPDAGQLLELFARLRNLAAVIPNQRFG